MQTIGKEEDAILKKQSGRADRAFLLAVLAVAVLLLAGSMLLRARGGDAVAEISFDGRRVAVLDLGKYRSQTPVGFSIRDYGVERDVSFELKEGKIRFVNVDCPDKLCEGFGFIGEVGQTAVCMPNRVAVTILERGNFPGNVIQ